jgi:riboflavin kinase/FMN adenylyltransferase
MRVHTKIKPDPSFQNGVVTIGTFDGVHLGHRQIIERLKKEAAETNRQTVIITFHPHPRKIVGSGTLQVPLITTTDEKIRLLQNLEIDHMVVVPFTETFANQTAEQYVEDFLIVNFNLTP